MGPTTPLTDTANPATIGGLLQAAYLIHDMFGVAEDYALDLAITNYRPPEPTVKAARWAARKAREAHGGRPGWINIFNPERNPNW